MRMELHRKLQEKIKPLRLLEMVDGISKEKYILKQVISSPQSILIIGNYF